MIKKQFLVVLITLCASFMGFGQVSITGLGAGNTYTEDFNTLANTGTSTSVPTGWSFSELGTNANTDYTAGTGSGTAGDTYSFGSSLNSERCFGGLLSGSLVPTIGASFTNNTGATVTDLIITYTGEQWRLGATGRIDRLDFQYSLDATSLTTGSWTNEDNLDFIAPITTGTVGALDGNLAANRTSKTFTITGLSIANGTTFWFRWNDLNATGADDGLGIDDFSIYAIGLTDDVDWCNVDPANGIIDLGNQFYIYAQAWENGVTNSPGQGAGLLGWIGYSTTNTDPSGGGWTWVAASYFDEVDNNDRFRLDIGSAIPTIGTYYYASRFQLNGGPYQYGGYNAGGGGFWNGTTNVNGALTVNARTLDWCNLQSPNVGSISLGNSYNVYAQVYELGITENTPAQPGANIQAWIGYSSVNNDPSINGGWTWLPAGHNTLCGANCGFPTENNDEYFTDIGSGLPVGTYYYASRFTIDDPSVYYYGGWSGTGGGFWQNGVNVNGVLTITLADVVITEIMYNTSGTDDDWIEICNVSGSMQDISNYIIDVAGIIEYTFPSNTNIAYGDCITVDLKDGGGTEYNVDCPFVPDYTDGSNTNTLVNSSRTITLFAANGTTAVDIVTYDNGDGADGNVKSLHVIDASIDNSDTGFNWTEVDYGGSPGTNSLMSPCAPAGPEINVEGDTGSYPDIANGDTSPNGTDNTLFAAQFIGSSQAKSFRIQNLGTANNLTGINISIGGINPGDFSVSLTPSATVLPLNLTTFEITFAPTATGVRTADISISNNDSDENPYTFRVQGTGNCAANSITITPISGPENTIVTVTGINLSIATASFNSIPATVNNISATEMEVIVPVGASTGNLEITDDNGCPGSAPFTVIDNQIGSCEGGSALSELFISEVTDATYGSLTYIEIYNATGSNIDLTNYSIRIYSNGNTVSYSEQILSGIINSGDIFILTIGTFGVLGNALCSVPGGDGLYGDLISNNLAGVNIGTGDDDFIGLYNSGVLIDAFGVFGDNDWTSSTILTGNRGFNFRRLNSATSLPSNTFATSDWNIIDWVGSGSPSCESTNDYSNIGVFDFSTGTPPSVATGPTINSSCNTATISVTGTEGSDPAGLAYQWYYSAPGEPGWTAISNGGFYNNANSATLNILESSSLEGYQYYCQIREDDADCYTASDAVQLTLPTTTWDGTSWSSPPTIDKIAILEDDYTTAVGTNGETSFSACSLIINDGVTLTISDLKNGGVNTYVEVKNDLIVQGTGAIIVHPQAAFVQINDNGQVTADNPDNIQVNKETAPAQAWYEYTYWSSPVQNETIADGLSDAATNRRFRYNAQNYKDSEKENGNSGNYSPGHDDIDDNGDDWVLTSGSDIMIAGVGYASTHSSFIFGITPGCPGINCHIQYTFNGLFNNGVINVPVYRNDDETDDNNWNLIGNPYPSAIYVNDFLTQNANVFGSVPLSPPVEGLSDGVIFLWSQDSPPDKNNPGNENQNFKQSDYAIINLTMQTAGGDGITPSRYIPSGQSFFMAYANSPAPGNLFSNSPDPIYQGTVTFNNSMRVKGTTDNSQFFRTNGGGSNKSKMLDNKLWVNLTSDNGVFNQIAVGYVDYATNAYDGMGYDTPRNLSNPLYSSIYTLISGHDKKFAIQGKDPNSLNLDEVIPLGFDTTINEATVYTLSIENVEGDFLSSNPIYLKDNLLNKVHDLTASDYSFTSEVGEFKDRFEIVFQSESLSDIEAQLNINKLTIIELNDGRVQLKTNSIHSIKSVQILDLLGRTLYQLKGTNSTEIYNLNTLSQAAYIAKVELSNGQIITKKAIKRN